MLIITSGALKTTEGVGVGSTLAELRRAYPKLVTRVDPGLWEEPSCVAVPEPKSALAFFLGKCDMRAEDPGEAIAPDEKVIRIVIFDFS
jgi:hypothetical protein